jgi:DNA adenine methylase
MPDPNGGSLGASYVVPRPITPPLRPPFNYFGGKQRVAERIAALLPEHRHYVEPFAGGLSVLLAKPPSKLETVNDLDGDLMTFWRVLRDRPDDLCRVAALTPHSRAEQAAARDLDVADDLERARRVWVTLAQGRGGVLRNTGWRFFSDPDGTNTSMPGYLAGYVGRMPPAAARLSAVSLECRDALDVIADYGKHRDVCIYADPPYLGSTRGWGNNYRHELRTDEQHQAVAEALHACEASVVLSGYHSPLYDEMYGDWARVEIPSYTGNGNVNARTEVLWSNRPLDAAAPDLTLFSNSENGHAAGAPSNASSPDSRP